MAETAADEGDDVMGNRRENDGDDDGLDIDEMDENNIDRETGELILVTPVIVGADVMPPALDANATHNADDEATRSEAETGIKGVQQQTQQQTQQDKQLLPQENQAEQQTQPIETSEQDEELSEEEKQEMLKDLVRKSMFEAARAGDIDRLDDLLDFACADINMTRYGENLLMAATRARQLDVAEFLIDNGIDVNFEVTLVEYVNNNTAVADLHTISCRQLACDLGVGHVVELIDEQTGQEWGRFRPQTLNTRPARPRRLKRPLVDKLRERSMAESLISDSHSEGHKSHEGHEGHEGHSPSPRSPQFNTSLSASGNDVVMATAEGLQGLYGPLGRPSLKDITAEQRATIADDVREGDDADWWPEKSFKMTRSAMSRRRQGVGVVSQLDHFARSGLLLLPRGVLGRPPPSDVMTLPEGSKVTVFRSRSAMEFARGFVATSSVEGEYMTDTRRSARAVARPKSSILSVRHLDQSYSAPVLMPLPKPAFMTPIRAASSQQEGDSADRARVKRTKQSTAAACSGREALTQRGKVLHARRDQVKCELTLRAGVVVESVTALKPSNDRESGDHVVSHSQSHVRPRPKTAIPMGLLTVNDTTTRHNLTLTRSSYRPASSK